MTLIRPIEIKGNTTDKKFKSVEKIFSRFSRRLHKTVIGAIPPIPVVHYIADVPSDGVIYRCLIPCHGNVTNVCLYVEEFVDSGNAKFTVRAISNSDDRSVSFETKRNLNVDKTFIKVEPGTRVILSTDSPACVKGVWVAFLIEVGLKGTHREAFLIDSFEKIIDGEIEEDLSDA